MVEKSRFVEVSKEALMEIAEGIIDVVVKKNTDYGDAWQCFGTMESLLRIYVKSLRYMTLSQYQHVLIADETVNDTLLDIVGYALLIQLYKQEVYDGEDSWPAEGNTAEEEEAKVFDCTIKRDGKVIVVKKTRGSSTGDIGLRMQPLSGKDQAGDGVQSDSDIV